MDNLGDIAGHRAETIRVGGERLTGDFDGDEQVGFGDFLAFAQHFGSRLGDRDWDSLYDLDKDESVGFTDFLIFAGAFGKNPVAKPVTGLSR